MKKYLVLIVLPFSLLMCKTVPPEIPADLEPKEYFQRAQEAVVERNDYDTALVYYQTFLERFPNDLQRGVEADYEIAFIYYKKGDLETAEKLFDVLIATYREDVAQVLPRWPYVLAEKVLENIQSERTGSTQPE